MASTSGINREAVCGHAFLQAIMHQGCIKESDAKNLYKIICNIESDAGYSQFISDINLKLSFANFELKRIKFPGDNREYIGYVNSEEDEPSKAATAHRTKEGKPDIRYAAYFRALVDRLVAQEDAPDGLGIIDEREALNMTVTVTSSVPGTQDASTDGAGPATAPTTLPALRINEKEAALASFLREKWLAHHPQRSEAYCLGPRGIMELGPNLVESDDIPERTKATLNKALGYET